MPFESTPEEDDGGDVYSLKVVKVSLWLALLCIWSSAWERVSLSSGVVLEREAKEPRREVRYWERRVEADGLSVSLIDLELMVLKPHEASHCHETL